MSGKRRSLAQITRDRRRIADLYLRGWLQVDIAAEVGLNQSTVSRDLTVLQDDWKRAALMDLNEAKARELAKVDALEIEYWKAWENSLKDAEVFITEKVGTQKGTNMDKRGKEVFRREGQTGNPSFLAGIQWCINKRCEILGLDAPKSTDLTSGGDRIRAIGLGVDIDKL